ncbi:metalloenzyme [Dipodascopsis uninucleata]
MTDQKVCLIVIDGWGIGQKPPKDGDAIAAADTPTMDFFATQKGYTTLEASSTFVGLPEGLMGNSEVGHLNIGAGRVVWQDVVRIDMSIKKGEFSKVDNVVKAMETAKSESNGRLHLMGLLSDGGVHSHQKHLFELLKTAKLNGLTEVYVHAFGDGRDTDPKSLTGYMETLLGVFKEIGVGKLATVVGRYYAMDRDKRWDRVEIALKGIIAGEGETSTEDEIVSTIKARYEAGETDEFIRPIIVNGPDARVRAGDSIFVFNYRSDRAREITQLLGVDSSPIDLPIPENLKITTMTQYKADYPFSVAFPPQRMGDVLAEWLGKQNVRQVHIAETEKYAHVTFFFNGGVEKQYNLEERDMIPSPKVATYDLDPKMSQHKVADKVASRMAEQKFPFVMCNLAAPDMVGHTGKYEAAIVAVTHCDQAIKTIYDACVAQGYVLFVTADHGNAEEMKTDEGKPKTSHTTNKVPLVMANAPAEWSLKHGGALGDVAPTILSVMGLPQPEDMTGSNLLVK